MQIVRHERRRGIVGIVIGQSNIGTIILAEVPLAHGVLHVCVLGVCHPLLYGCIPCMNDGRVFILVRHRAETNEETRVREASHETVAGLAYGKSEVQILTGIGSLLISMLYRKGNQKLQSHALVFGGFIPYSHVRPPLARLGHKIRHGAVLARRNENCTTVRRVGWKFGSTVRIMIQAHVAHCGPMV